MNDYQRLLNNYEAVLASPDTSPVEVEARTRIQEATTLEEITNITAETYRTICGTREFDTFQNTVVPLVLRIYKYNPRSAGVLLLDFIERVGDMKVHPTTLEDGQLNDAERDADFKDKFDNLLFATLDPAGTESRAIQGQRLDALSPVDGRYARHTEGLRKYFSTRALTRYRVVMETEYLISLMETLTRSDDPTAKASAARMLTEEEITFLRDLTHTLPAEIVQTIETRGYKGIARTNHDVTAVQKAVQREMLRHPTLKDLAHFVHLGTTSEDTTSCAYALMLKGALETIVVPSFQELIRALKERAVIHASAPTEEYTHSQLATPKTFGVTMRVLAERLKEQQKTVCALPIKAKLTGAVGNLAALSHTFPTIDWIQFSKKFITSLNDEEDGEAQSKFVIEPNLYTKQIEPHDNLVQILQSLQLQAGILEGACLDIWNYIGFETIVQKVAGTDRAQETGSSTMPQKINPIDFENSESNFALVQALCDIFIRRLPKSRMGRDLSDSTLLRNLGVIFGHLAIGLSSFRTGLEKIEPNTEGSRENLADHPEVLSEFLQVFCRACGIQDAYDRLKELTRGQKITRETLVKFIEELPLTSEQKQKLLGLQPYEYIGESEKIARGEA